MSSPIILLPRMNGLDVQQALEAMSPASGSTFGVEVVDNLPDSVTFAAVGGTPATARELADVRRKIEEIARSCGYPEQGSAERRARFDAACAELLGAMPIFQSGEALRDDVWAFIATVLLAPVTYWRFGISQDRWQGGIRNTFQRLWVRARALDRGQGHQDRWGLLHVLTEDALVALTERTAIAAQRHLALAIGEGWLRAAEIYGRGHMEPIMRRAIIALRLKNEVMALGMLPSSMLATIVDQSFAKAAVSLGLDPISGDERRLQAES